MGRVPVALAALGAAAVCFRSAGAVRETASGQDPREVTAVDALTTQLAGTRSYFEFVTARGNRVWGASFGGRGNATPAAVMSVSKIFVSFAVMRSMHLRPGDWHPDRPVHELGPGGAWARFRDLEVYGTGVRANLTIKHLLMHTSGIPAVWHGHGVDLDDIVRRGLCFEPGTGWSYTYGHRVLGWLLRDYWQAQNASVGGAPVRTVHDAMRLLVYEPLGFSSATKFCKMMKIFAFGGSEAGDGGICSTAADMRKLAVVALRRGQTLDGRVLVDEARWNEWAVPNLLPGRKLARELRAWTCPWYKLEHDGWRRPDGDLMGQNLFAMTWGVDRAGWDRGVGWRGFRGSILHVSYERDVAFVMTATRGLGPRRPVATGAQEGRERWYNIHFADMADDLLCAGAKACAAAGERLTGRKAYGAAQRAPGLPLRAGWVYKAGAGRPSRGTLLQAGPHVCYVPRCSKHHLLGTAARRRVLRGEVARPTATSGAAIQSPLRRLRP